MATLNTSDIVRLFHDIDNFMLHTSNTLVAGKGPSPFVELRWSLHVLNLKLVFLQINSTARILLAKRLKVIPPIWSCFTWFSRIGVDQLDRQTILERWGRRCWESQMNLRRQLWNFAYAVLLCSSCENLTLRLLLLLFSCQLVLPTT